MNISDVRLELSDNAVLGGSQLEKDHGKLTMRFHGIAPLAAQAAENATATALRYSAAYNTVVVEQSRRRGQRTSDHDDDIVEGGNRIETNSSNDNRVNLPSLGSTQTLVYRKLVWDTLEGVALESTVMTLVKTH